MPTTASRWWTIPLAVKCWQQQTYPFSELVVVVDGPETIPGGGCIRDLLPPDENIRYEYLEGQRTLGCKYNECIKLARHEWVALWADDDWHGPDRLERTAKLIAPRIGVIGDWTFLQHELFEDGITKYYIFPQRSPQYGYVISGTMAFRRSLGLAYPFEDLQKESDGFFVVKLIEESEYYGRLYQEDGSHFYVAMIHGQNTASLIPRDDPIWYDWDHDLNAVMGGMLPEYEAAYRRLLDAG
jgi:glycosyltransferase involved in cell wall biosynthesis